MKLLTIEQIVEESSKIGDSLTPDDVEQMIIDLLVTKLKEQRESCLDAYRSVGKARFKSFHSKKVEEAIITAKEPRI